MAYQFLTAGHSGPAINGSFRNSDGKPINCTDRTVTISMRPWNDSTPVFTGQVASFAGDPAEGNAFFVPDPSDVHVGHYLVKWYINPGDLALPLDGWEHVLVSPDI